jgi:hypothetical protein
VRDEHGKPQAQEGAHDDTVMALAIAFASRDQQSYVDADTALRVEWSDSQWEDYHNAASPGERAAMEQMWGNPAPRRTRPTARVQGLGERRRVSAQGLLQGGRGRW